MILRNIILRNFQSWKHQKIELSPGFNAIIGDSDSGKSAIERAVRWVVENRPTGDEFVSWFADKNESTYVRLNFEDTYVTRKKEGKKNYYKTKDATLETFGSSVPDEIKDVLDFQEYNIQSQHKKYFLLQETPGERAKILNQAVGLDIIDELFSYLNSRNLEIGRSLRDVTANKEKIEQTLSNFPDLDGIEKSLTILKSKSDKYKALAKIANKLHSSIRNLEEIESKIQDEKVLVDIEGIYNELASKKKDCEKYASVIKKGNSILNSIESVSENIERSKGYLDQHVSKYLGILEKNKVCPICGNNITKDTIKEIKRAI